MKKGTGTANRLAVAGAFFGFQPNYYLKARRRGRKGVVAF